MIPKHWLDIRRCLFDAFANADVCDPQKPRQMWAIIEGMRRIDLTGFTWSDPRADKEHTCVRGRTIKSDQTYFKLATGGGWGSEPKFCAGCMAMILYFKEVDKLPPDTNAYWDSQANQPVSITSQEYRRSQHNA